jgi:hypothetical protein
MTLVAAACCLLHRGLLIQLLEIRRNVGTGGQDSTHRLRRTRHLRGPVSRHERLEPLVQRHLDLLLPLPHHGGETDL